MQELWIKKLSVLGTILEDFKQFTSHIVKYAQHCVARDDSLERYDSVGTSTGFQCAANIVELLDLLVSLDKKNAYNKNN